MSDETSQAVEVFADAEGRQYTQEVFKLGASEVAERYRGGEITYRLPALGENIEATLRNFSAFVHPEADLNAVVLAKLNGQGVRLDVQKEIKQVLGHGNAENMARPVEDVMADARALAEGGFQLGTPRVRKAGEKSVGKLKTAESQRDKAVNVTLDMYRKLSRTMRAQYGPTLVAQGLPGVTQEALDAIDAEA